MGEARGKWKIKRTHTKLTLTLLLIAVLLSGALSFTLYQMFQGTALAIARKNAAGSLDQNIAQVRLIQNNIAALGVQLLEDPTVVQAIFSQKPLSAAQGVRLFRRARSLTATDAMIHSVCFYNAASDRLYSYFDVEGDEEYQQTMREVLAQGRPAGSSLFVPSQVTFRRVTGATQTDHILTALFTDASFATRVDDQGTEWSSAVLINLNADVMQGTLMADSPEGLARAVVTDANGAVVFDSARVQMEEALPPGAPVQEWMPGEAGSGSAVRSLNGEKSLWVYRGLESPAWLFTYIYSFADLFREMDGLRLSILYVCLLVIVFAAVYAFVMSKKLFHPLELLLQSIGTGRTAAHRQGESDLEYLTRMYQGLNSRARRLEAAYQQNGLFLLREYLSLLAKGLNDRAQRLKEKWGEQLALPSGKDRRYFVLAVALSEETREGTKALRGAGGNLYESSVEILVVTALSGAFWCEPLEYVGRTMYLLLGVPAGAEPGDLEAPLKRIHDALQGSLGQRLCFALGLPAETLERISDSYFSAAGLLRYRFHFGLEAFLTCGMEEIDQLLPYTPIQSEPLIRAVRSGSRREADLQLAALFEKLSLCQYDFVQLTLSQLMFDFVKLVYQFYNTDSTQVNFDNIADNVQNLRTIEEAQAFFTLYCQGLIGKIELRKDGMRANMIQETLSHIARHYADHELSTESLAEMVHLTPGYFGKIFRDHVGKTVSEVISETRMKAACRLLASSGDTVARIGDQVGYHNPTYFITTFKRHFGVSPNQYRKECQAEDDSIL